MKRDNERKGEIKNIRKKGINEEGQWEGRKIFKRRKKKNRENEMNSDGK